jgi:hypothetical protein
VGYVEGLNVRYWTNDKQVYSAVIGDLNGDRKNEMLKGSRSSWAGRVAQL